MYGWGTKSWRNSAEKRQLDRERAEVTAQLVANPDSLDIGLICTCRSFRFPHNPADHKKLRSDMDWRTANERRNQEIWQERIA